VVCLDVADWWVWNNEKDLYIRHMHLPTYKATHPEGIEIFVTPMFLHDVKKPLKFEKFKTLQQIKTLTI